MDDVYVYYADLPGGVTEMITPCADGYTVYLDTECLCDTDRRLRKYRHAINHIGDFHGGDVQRIERRRHE